MSQQILNNGETGLVIRTKINANDTELYALAAASAVSIAALQATDAAAAAAAIAASTVPYHFHGFAGFQILGNPKFRDFSGMGNHGSFGTDLSNANAWANAGYASTVNPTAGVSDSVIRIPGVNFDYAGGEKLFLFWLGKVTAEGAVASFIGDGLGTGFPGFRLRINADGTGQMVISSTSAQAFSENSEIFADGTLRAFACVVDGANRSYGMWVDDPTGAFGAVGRMVFEHSLFDRYVPFGVALPGPGPSIDTRCNNTWNIGNTAPKSAADTTGLATQTRAMVLLRFGATEAVPSVPRMTALCQALYDAPHKLVTEFAIS